MKGSAPKHPLPNTGFWHQLSPIAHIYQASYQREAGTTASWERVPHTYIPLSASQFSLGEDQGSSPTYRATTSILWFFKERCAQRQPHWLSSEGGCPASSNASPPPWPGGLQSTARWEATVAAASWGCAMGRDSGPSLGISTVGATDCCSGSLHPQGAVSGHSWLCFPISSHLRSDNKGLLGCLAWGERLVSVQPGITLPLQGGRWRQNWQDWFPHWAQWVDEAGPRGTCRQGSLEATQEREPSPVFQESPEKQDENSSAFSGQPPLCAHAPGVSRVTGGDMLGACAATSAMRGSSTSKPDSAPAPQSASCPFPWAESHFPHKLSVVSGLWKPCLPPLSSQHTHSMSKIY